MRRRFNHSSGPVQIGQGVEPFSINTTGVYIYDIYGYCHDVASWPNGYGDEAAGVMVYSSGNPSSELIPEHYPCRYVIGKNIDYDAGGALTSVNITDDFIHTKPYNITEDSLSAGIVNSIVLAKRGDKSSYGGNYRKKISINRNGVAYEFYSYFPDYTEAYSLMDLHDQINVAMTRIGAQEINPDKDNILTSYVLSTNSYSINYDKSINKETNTKYHSALELIIFPVGLIPIRYASSGIYKDIGERNILASINLVDNNLFRFHDGNINNTKFIPIPFSTDKYVWSEKYGTTNTPLENYTVDNARSDNDGLYNSDTYIDEYPDETGGVFYETKQMDAGVGWCQTKAYVPSAGEIYQLFVDNYPIGPILFYTGAAVTTWSSTEVNRNRAIACSIGFLNEYTASLNVTMISNLKSEERRFMPIYIKA